MAQSWWHVLLAPLHIIYWSLAHQVNSSLPLRCPTELEGSLDSRTTFYIRDGLKQDSVRGLISTFSTYSTSRLHRVHPWPKDLRRVKEVLNPPGMQRDVQDVSRKMQKSGVSILYCFSAVHGPHTVRKTIKSNTWLSSVLCKLSKRGRKSIRTLCTLTKTAICRLVTRFMSGMSRDPRRECRLDLA